MIMDNEIVIVTLEYHVMAESAAQAIERVLESLRIGIDAPPVPTAPYNLSIKTVTHGTGNI